MRHYRLTEEERRVLRAPAEIDGFGILVLTLFDRWPKDALFVLVRAFVDESGTGGEGRVMLAALVGKAKHWIDFHINWRRPLKSENIEYSHLTDMENKKAPFDDWGFPRTNQFVGKADEIIQAYCEFGFTSAVSVTDHKVHYRDLLGNHHKDSSYGTCARSLIEGVVMDAVAGWGPDTLVNFVFEDNQKFEDARRIFKDLKDHVPQLAPNMGRIAPGEKKEIGGLQAADILVSLYRRAEERRCSLKPSQEAPIRAGLMGV